jgi:hypothetical protein
VRNKRPARKSPAVGTNSKYAPTAKPRQSASGALRQTPGSSEAVPRKTERKTAAADPARTKRPVMPLTGTSDPRSPSKNRTNSTRRKYGTAVARMAWPAKCSSTPAVMTTISSQTALAINSGTDLNAGERLNSCSISQLTFVGAERGLGTLRDAITAKPSCRRLGGRKRLFPAYSKRIGFLIEFDDFE